MPDLGFSRRLKSTLERKGLSQSDLARSLSLSQAAVSRWIQGDRTPSSAKWEELAGVLGVSVDWLRRGEGSEPAPDLARQRKEYADQVGWIFRTEPADCGRDYGNANMWALNWGIDTLVREAIQNSRDVPLEDDTPVEVEFKLIRLAGSNLDSFLETLRWNGSSSGLSLRPHIAAAASSGQKLGSVLKDGLADLERHGELLLLRVDDRRARGLTGLEFGGEGNFAALCRNNLHSDKQGMPLAGGSYGLGKAVFWRASKVATVLFRSDLSEPVREDGLQLQEGRIIGRSDLSWHELGDNDRFAGLGWFGRRLVVGNQPVAASVWSNEALAHDLFLDRKMAADGPGTSIMVVGFHDPSSDLPKEMQALAIEMTEAATQNFWPALESGHLVVKVSTYEGRDEIDSMLVSVGNNPAVRPFVEAVRSFRQNDLSERLTEPGSVVERRVILRVPRRKVAPPHRELDHDAILLVRRDADGEQGELSGHIAFFRGREMVIRYDRLQIPGVVPFHAVVLCGEATGGDEDDRAAERFLRIAEPPAHNEWRVTPDLKAEYVSGGGAAINRFFESVREEVRQLVKPQVEDLDEGPQVLKELLRLSERPEVRPQPTVVVDGRESFIDKSGRWNIAGQIRLPDGRAWKVSPVLLFAAETGGGRPVSWELDVNPPSRVDGDELVIPAGQRVAQFRGVSNPDSHPVPAAECVVRVELRRFQSSAPT